MPTKLQMKDREITIEGGCKFNVNGRGKEADASITVRDFSDYQNLTEFLQGEGYDGVLILSLGENAMVVPPGALDNHEGLLPITTVGH